MIHDKILNKVYADFTRDIVFSTSDPKIRMSIQRFKQTYNQPEKPQFEDLPLQLDFQDEICCFCGSLKKYWSVNKI